MINGDAIRPHTYKQCYVHQSLSNNIMTRYQLVLIDKTLPIEILFMRQIVVCYPTCDTKPEASTTSPSCTTNTFLVVKVVYKVINRHDTWITVTSFINGTISSQDRSQYQYLLYPNLVSGYQLRPTYNHSDLDQSLPVYHLLQKMNKDNYHHGTSQ